MNADTDGSGCYTHSREFTHGGYTFRVRINDDLMSYTAAISCDDEIVSVVTDLGPEAAQWYHAVLAEKLLG